MRRVRYVFRIVRIDGGSDCRAAVSRRSRGRLPAQLRVPHAADRHQCARDLDAQFIGQRDADVCQPYRIQHRARRDCGMDAARVGHLCVLCRADRIPYAVADRQPDFAGALRAAATQTELAKSRDLDPVRGPVFCDATGV